MNLIFKTRPDRDGDVSVLEIDEKVKAVYVYTTKFNIRGVIVSKAGFEEIYCICCYDNHYRLITD